MGVGQVCRQCGEAALRYICAKVRFVDDALSAGHTTTRKMYEMAARLQGLSSRTDAKIKDGPKAVLRSMLKRSC